MGYVTGQYVLSKITEAGERMGSDRTAKEKYGLHEKRANVLEAKIM